MRLYMRFKVVFSFLILLTIFLPAKIGRADYVDIGDDYTFKEAIDYWTEIGVLNGYFDGSFKPENPINRAEFLKFVLLAGGIEIDLGQYHSCFQDVEKEWFAPYICYAKVQGWVQGYGDGYFQPGRMVNEAESAKLIVNSLSLEWSSLNGVGPLTRGELAELLYELLVEDVEINSSEESILELLDRLAEEYGIPSWFLKAIVHRESTFNPDLINMDDGIEGDENWNHWDGDCAITEDGYPHGVGLTQLTGWMYQGRPFPFCLDEADDTNEDYFYSMAESIYGEWIDMEEVSRLEDPFDPEENVRRFLTGYAIPAYTLFDSLYGDSEEETWRRVAFHWNKGLYVDYDPTNTDYLETYDAYAELYQGQP